MTALTKAGGQPMPVHEQDRERAERWLSLEIGSNWRVFADSLATQFAAVRAEEREALYALMAQVSS